jgi:hypothetical protein
MKKVWNAPQLAVYGSAEAITQKTMAKSLGAGDDLATTIATNPNFGNGGKLS